MKQKVFIIGGTGSLGRAFIKRKWRMFDIVVFSRDEHKHHHLKKEFPNVEFIIGDIKDYQSIRSALLKFRPNTIINAAALKHVHVCENNPIESVNVNILGHQNLINAVREGGLDELNKLIFVSTDKACYPLNTYGMSKSIAEQIYYDFKKETKIGVYITRYGNVVNSSGSAIPYFIKLMKENAPEIPITSNEMTRFFITLDQAVNVVASCGSDADCLYSVPILNSFYIRDIISYLADTLNYNGDIVEIGPRRGEKINEDLFGPNDNLDIRDQLNYSSYTTSQAQDIINTYQRYNSKDFVIETDVNFAIKYLLQQGGVEL
jgi:FlaA1/EpsC-like NDP-sugar epimerase